MHLRNTNESHMLGAISVPEVREVIEYVVSSDICGDDTVLCNRYNCWNVY